MNAIITGATKGMGRAIAFKLAEAGYNIIFCARNKQEIDTLCNDLMALNPSVSVQGLVSDCSDSLQVERFSGFVQQHFATVDVLINNVGVFIPASVLDEEEGNFQKQLQINYLTAYHLCRVFGRKMRDNRKGHIINICSVAAITPVVAAGSYSVTKAALLSLTKVLRQELMAHRVKVTAIHPGSTLTSSWEGTTIPPERFIAAADVADAVLCCLKMSVGANPDELLITPSEGNI
ncbi:SDR family NAD(P)-dependent oxidoreductase [Desertivirga arenae]|uniref:SDR family NAD(P)-dependent oxidoreductase n=1 Tax=Desertivirga arenae TaxID=2810309 RepID=UPI001A97A459|nr:SDR family oxidoreductase [Pedobacter sp. SYSU D00823]